MSGIGVIRGAGVYALVRTWWSSLAAASGLALLGLAVGRRRPDRGADASPSARV